MQIIRNLDLLHKPRFHLPFLITISLYKVLNKYFSVLACHLTDMLLFSTLVLDHILVFSHILKSLFAILFCWFNMLNIYFLFKLLLLLCYLLFYFTHTNHTNWLCRYLILFSQIMLCKWHNIVSASPKNVFLNINARFLFPCFTLIVSYN